jgi:hypothetical protein
MLYKLAGLLPTLQYIMSLVQVKIVDEIESRLANEQLAQCSS